MIHVVKLVSKSSLGTKILNQSGNPEHWMVKDQKEELSWSTREGPWLFVAPENKSHYDHNRWVSLTDDHDFFVEIVR